VDSQHTRSVSDHICYFSFFLVCEVRNLISPHVHCCFPRRDTIEEIPGSNKSDSLDAICSLHYQPPSRKKEGRVPDHAWYRPATEDDELPERKSKPESAPAGLFSALFSAVLGRRERRVVPSGEAEYEADPYKGVFRPFYSAMRALSQNKSRSSRPREEKKSGGNGPFKMYSSSSTMSLATTSSSSEPVSTHSRSASRHVPMLALSAISSS
jgi:hypothetical protein